MGDTGALQVQERVAPARLGLRRDRNIRQGCGQELGAQEVTWGDDIHAAGCCAVCGRMDGLEAHHIISRSHHAIANYTENGILLCASCHRGKQSAHNTPRWFLGWLAENRPEQAAWVEANRWKIVK